MTMSAYRKFSDTLREIEVRESTAPKAGKLSEDAGLEPQAKRTLDALGGLGGGELDTRNTLGAEHTTEPASKEHCRIGQHDFANGVHGHLNHLNYLSPQSSCGGAKEECAAAVERDGDAIRRNAASAMEPQLVAPASWFERSAPPASGEPSFDKPCIPRRGRVERQGRLFLHFCIACGAWGAFGYGVTGDRPGRWYCREHRPTDEIS
jgi:hypothetical protein